jgi:hypothetical protein
MTQRSSGNVSRVAQPTLIKKTSVALIAPAWPAATMLFIADQRQYCPPPLIVGDGAVVDMAKSYRSRGRRA